METIKKDNLWKYENPIYTIENVKINKCHHVNLNKKITKKIGICDRSVLLMRFSDRVNDYWISKVSLTPYGCSFHLGERVLKKTRFKEGQIKDIQIIQKKELGVKSHFSISNNRLDITALLPNPNFLYFVRPGEWITIYSFPHSYITIKRFINLDNYFFWLIGFYLAEGDKTNQFGVSNTNSDLLRLFKNEYEKRFGINKNEWLLELRSNNYDEKIKEFWSKELCIDLDKISLSVAKMKINSYYGVARLRIRRSRPLLRLWVNFISDFALLEKLFSKKEHILYFLRGLEAGDGYVSLRINKRNWKKIEVGIQQKTNKELIYFVAELFGKLYGKPYIEISKEKGLKILYWNCNKIRDLVIDDHFLEHKKRREKLIKNYCMTRFGKSDIKYLLALENNTNKEIAKKLNFLPCSAHEKLARMIKLGLVKKQKIGKKLKYFLTDKGKYFLECLLSVGEGNEQKLLYKNLWLHSKQIRLSYND